MAGVGGAGVVGQGVPVGVFLGCGPSSSSHRHQKQNASIALLRAKTAMASSDCM